MNLNKDEWLLERAYCFEDFDDPANTSLTEPRRVVLHVHTLLKWCDRNKDNLKPQKRVNKLTSVNVRFAYRVKHYQEEDGCSSLTLVPVCEKLFKEWRVLFQGGAREYDKMEWEWRKDDSMPRLEDTSSAAVYDVYNQVRSTIALGQRLFHDKSMKNTNLWHQPYGEKDGTHTSNTNLRGEEELEYDVFVPDPSQSPPSSDTPSASAVPDTQAVSANAGGHAKLDVGGARKLVERR
jgi:hypothetical protein